MEKNPSSDIRVYAIWFNTLPGAARDKWNASLMTDSRVKQFWDEEKIAGRFFGEQEGFMFGSIAYDAYYLYGPDAVWDATPSPLISYGYTVLGKGNVLRADLLESLGES